MLAFRQRFCDDEVGFPGPATISRESLLKAARVRGDFRNTEAKQNGFTVVRFLIVELAVAIFERADYR